MLALMLVALLVLVFRKVRGVVAPTAPLKVTMPVVVTVNPKPPLTVPSNTKAGPLLSMLNVLSKVTEPAKVTVGFCVGAVLAGVDQLSRSNLMFLPVPPMAIWLEGLNLETSLVKSRNAPGAVEPLSRISIVPFSAAVVSVTLLLLIESELMARTPVRRVSSPMVDELPISALLNSKLVVPVATMVRFRVVASLLSMSPFSTIVLPES
jgi:hypothetical protein